MPFTPPANEFIGYLLVAGLTLLGKAVVQVQSVRAGGQTGVAP